jgi:hypothetical protein
MKLSILLLLISLSAFADPAVKQAEIGLDPTQKAVSFHPGDEIKLLVVAKEKLGEVGDPWKLDTKDTHRWVPFGDVSIDAQSARIVESSDALTKISLTGMLIGAGEAKVDKLALLNTAGTIHLDASGAVASKVGSLLTEEDKKNTVWLLDPVAVGGWNFTRIILLAAAAILLGALLVYSLWRFWKKKKKVVVQDPKEIALAELAKLENFATNHNKRSQTEWKHFSYSLAHLLRKLCEDLYHFPTHDLTDKELLDALKPHMDQKRYLESLAEILQAIDGTRYGQQDGEISVATKLLVDAKNFIEQLCGHEKAKLEPKVEAKK